MAKIKYYYDTETCRYERIKPSTQDILVNSFGLIFICVILGGIFAFAYINLFPSQKELRLQKENKQLLYYYEKLTEELDQSQMVLRSLQERDDEIYRVIFEAEAIPEEIRMAGAGGSAKYRDIYEQNFDRQDLIVSLFQKIDALKRQMYVQTNSYDEIVDLVESKQEMLRCIPAIQPISNSDLKRFASGFGMRLHPIHKVRRMHYGCDFSAPKGTPIYATGDGKVVTARRSMQGYGNMIEIDHGFDYMTRYAHMSEFAVKSGEKVKRGQIIGYVGSTGLSVANHLHYEVHYRGKQVNPVNYFHNDLTPNQYEKLLEIANQENQSLGF